MDNPNINTDYKISFCMKSDIGRIRFKNEDFSDEFVSKAGWVFLVCDGLGGHAGGDVASKLAVNTIKDFITLNADKISDIPALIHEAINTANNTLLYYTKNNPEFTGMGTTCIILILNKRLAYFGNVGDSRLYLIRGGKINRVSKDQSFVQKLVDRGIISHEEALIHPKRNQITQAIGIQRTIVPQLNFEGMPVFENDMFILCSDGLTGMLSDLDIFNAVENSGLPNACDKLIELANARGGTDNITVQVVRITV